ncbi:MULTISPECIES: hypothetical protein [Rhodovulum]|uniref:Long-subunit fatty acid transport protein n=2 Tax=Rhodovulum TaxID=34008 RepID=A0A8E2VP28_9RHOB|nr:MULTISPECIES: hypothetical protein [Rhodovulum]PTW51862.1 long-subunit fatty acid transport protein [Rhodovulum kholense]RAP42785.1 hypothetical protein BYZ73_03735 [Rhodovulum viride]
MKYAVGAAVLAAVTTGPAFAGGIERSVPSVGILFEQGTYVELGFSRFDPDVSGSSDVTGLGSGDMLPGFSGYSLAFKQDLGDSMAVALILDEPIGADVSYGSTNTYPVGSPLSTLDGAQADINSTGLTALLRYELPSNVNLIGGVRAIRTSGTVGLPGIGAYSMTSSTETDFGYILGVAWEKPEIAARVALTYSSAIDHAFDTVETAGAFSISNELDVTIPQSLTLEFQSGIAKDTLVFGSIRWVDWTAFDITPDLYTGSVVPGGSLVDYDHDVTTYNLGLGRKFNDNWSGAILFGYEKHEGSYTGNLGPTDGFRSIGLAATYTTGKVKVTGGVRYVDIGNAKTEFGPTTTTFKDNHGIGVGLRVGYYF